MTTPTSLFILTSSQAPLPVRYPHPHKPRLVIPPLVHRTLHNALDKDPSSSTSSNQRYLYDERSGRVVIPHPDAISKHDLPSAPSSSIATGVNGEEEKGVKTSMDTDTNIENTPVQASDGDLELTLKLHLISPSSTGSRSSWVQESLDVLADYKGLIEVDTLLIGWKGVDYKGKRTAVSEFFGCGAEGMESASGGEDVGEDLTREVKECWGDITRKIRSSTSETGPQRKIRRLGTMYLPLSVLQLLTTESTQGKGEKPAINMLDTPDCHHLSHEYSGFAKEQGIELWAGGGGEGADPLPDADLHNLLQEFTSHLPQISSSSQSLSSLIPLRADQLKYEPTPAGVQVKWVLGYAVMSKSRNVVVDKGYIISANFAS